MVAPSQATESIPWSHWYPFLQPFKHVTCLVDTNFFFVSSHTDIVYVNLILDCTICDLTCIAI